MQNKPIIRPFRDEDFQGVLDILRIGKVDEPQYPSELRGLCFVAEDGAGEIVGVVYAMVGVSTKAYVDYLAVRMDYQKGPLFFRLLSEVEKAMIAHGVKRYMFHVEQYNVAGLKQLFKRREKYNITKLRDLHYFSREFDQ
jgi:hypothetical protein